MRSYTVMCMTFDNGTIKFLQVPNVIANNEDEAKTKALQTLAKQGINAEIAPDIGLAKAVIENRSLYWFAMSATHIKIIKNITENAKYKTVMFFIDACYV